MDVMRTGVSALGTVLPEREDHNTPGARDIADRLLASLGSMLLYWYHWSHNGKRIDVETDDDSIGGHFLHLLHGRAAEAALGQGDAHVAHPLRRARVQRLDVRRPRHRRHRLRLLLVRSPARSARCADRSTAAPTRWPSRSQKRYDTPDEAEADMRRRVENKEVIIGFGHPRLHDRRPAQQGDQGARAQPVAGRREPQDVRDRRPDRGGHGGREEDVREPRLVFRGVLPHDGRAHRDVHAALRDLAHHRLVRARHRAADRQQDHPARPPITSGRTIQTSSCRSTSAGRRRRVANHRREAMSACRRQQRPPPNARPASSSTSPTTSSSVPRSTSTEAYETARLLPDGHARLRLRGAGLSRRARKLLGPVVPGTVVPGGAACPARRASSTRCRPRSTSAR